MAQQPIWPIALPIDILLLAFGLWRLWLEIRPKYWDQSKGKIISSRIDRQSQTVHGGISSFAYIPVVEFEYSYGGQTLRSTRWRAGNFVNGQQLKALSVIRRYPVGATVNVFVNPNNPEKAFLEYGISPASWVFLLVGLIFSAITLASIIWH